jgi:hypothetical protein
VFKRLFLYGLTRFFHIWLPEISVAFSWYFSTITEETKIDEFTPSPLSCRFTVNYQALKPQRLAVG